MPLAAGTKLGPYEITSPLGAGGMGEVYRAQDTRLGRCVAIKILPDKFSRDAQRMARFDREAKVLASLNHPNIAAIYGLEESSGVPALVMEFVDGPTLAEQVANGRLALDDALPSAKQIAEALEYAHERGIIHRDLKPANVKITPNGTAKVLDFGLAKALEDDFSTTDISTSLTLSHAATQAGILLGTAAYMSPEQARGKKVDRRADVWSFGAVLYEMLTGKPAFAGETISDTLAAVIRAEPDWISLPSNVPGSIVRLVRRCLTKDPNQRLRDIGEARIALDAAISGTPEDAAAPATTTEQTQPLWRRALPWALAAIAIALAMAFNSLYRRANQPEPHRTMQRTLALAEPLAGVFDPNPGSPFALSPDGSQIVFVASAVAKTLPAPPRVYSSPTLSPDGKLLAIQINDNGLLAIWIYEFARNTLTRLTFDPGSSSTPLWTPDGQRVIYNTRSPSPSFRSKLADGSGKEDTLYSKEFDDPGATPVSVSPDGKALLFSAYSPAGKQAIHALSLDGSDTIQPFLQTPANLNGSHFSPDGRWVAYTTDESGRREVCVQPFPIAPGK